VAAAGRGRVQPQLASGKTNYRNVEYNRKHKIFMEGRNIMSGIMALHEVLHETKKTKKVGIVLKLDFEKAYDKSMLEVSI
jgi:hypothetical protein